MHEDEWHDGSVTGLTSEEAAARLKTDGWNELTPVVRHTLWSLLLSVVRQPMLLMLIACGLLYIVLGSVRDALMLLASIILIIAIAVVQEGRTERSLEALRDLSSPRAMVVRDGRRQRIAGREVVRGDILLVAEGDRVPADAVLLSSVALSVDESLLTGESLPVGKRSPAGTEAAESLPENDPARIFAGTLVVRGHGTARVLRTGAETEIGRIGYRMATMRPEKSLLELQVNRLVRTVGLFSFSLCLILALLYGLSRHDWLNGLLAGLTLAMATLPEEFPMVLVIFLAIGAWRISRHQVLVRRLQAVEMLGAASVLCVDKTGTLTENRMIVRRIYGGDGSYAAVGDRPEAMPPEAQAVVRYAFLASSRETFDPMEIAIRELREAIGTSDGRPYDDLRFVREYPLSERLFAMALAWRSETSPDLLLAAKGAPEAIAELCRFSDEQKASLLATVGVPASEGMRIIAVATARPGREELPEDMHEILFSFAGLLAFEDPVRRGVPEALRECREAGIRVMMMTGDYPGTARRIAEQIGLDGSAGIMTGAELEALGQAERSRAIDRTAVFARMRPGQKFGIVEALKQQGLVVAMTGDGVNDAPALKSAHIGIAMGRRGTDVAREASSIVLVDDHFESIVRAVRMGRRIYDNLKKATVFLLAVHIPIAGMSLMPVLLNWPLALLPSHILFLELLIDPSCSMVFEMEADERGLMKRSPRNLDAPLVGRQVLLRALFQGIAVFLAIVTAYGMMQASGFSAEEARLVAFIGIVAANIGLIFANRSWDDSMFRTFVVPNRALWWVTGGAILFLAMVVSVPFLRELFRFGQPELHHLPLTVVLVLICFLLPDLVKSTLFRKWLH